jgi:hypothetical protein
VTQRGQRLDSGPAGPAEQPSGARLGRAGTAWRMAAVGLVLVALGVGTYRNTDDLFPFGPLAQFATSPDPNGRIRSAYVLADTADGRTVRVPLNPLGTGIGRAEVEGQIARFQEDPALLQVIADAYERMHPDGDVYVRLYLMRDVRQMKDAQPVGEPQTTVLATWTVAG